MKKQIFLFVVALFSCLYSAGAVADVSTPLDYPFTAVVDNLELRETPDIDNKVIGTVPAGVKLHFKKHGQSRAWILIDDTKQGVRGWALCSGGYFGDTMEQDYDFYASTLDYTKIQLGLNPHIYDEESDCEDNDAAIKQKYQRHYASERSTAENVLIYIIIILTGISALTAWMPVLPQPLKNNALWYLTALGIAEIILAIDYPVFHTFSEKTYLNMYLVAAIQLFAMMMTRTQKKWRPRFGRYVSIAGMIAVGISSIATSGVSLVIGSLIGGVLNVLIGIIVCIAIYAFFKDGLDSPRGSRGGNDDGKKQDYSCSTCSYLCDEVLGGEAEYCQFGHHVRESDCPWHSSRR